MFRSVPLFVAEHRLLDDDGSVHPSHPARVDGPHPVAGATDGLATTTVYLVPTAEPRVRIAWRYAVMGSKVMHPCGMVVEPAPSTTPDEWAHIGATMVRDLPLARLERAARLIAEFSLRADGDPPGPTWGKRPSADEIPEIARDMVRKRYPDLDPDAGAGAARSWRRLVRLAEVVLEHQLAQHAGEKSPTAAIAEVRGVAPATVRGWLHQANQEGFAPPPYVAGLDVFEEIAPIDPQGDADVRE